MDFLENFSDIPSDFIYVLVALLVLYISTKIVKATTGHIFALLCVYLLINFISKKSSEDFTQMNQEIDYRNEVLGAPTYFYLDVNIINLFYNLSNWRSKNPDNFDSAILAVNNVLKIRQDSEKPLLRCVDNYEIARDQAKIAMNFIHGFIYSIDQPLLVEKLKNTLSRLEQLLERHLLFIEEKCNTIEKNKSSIDVNSRFIEDSSGPKAFDTNQMTQFDFF